MPTRAKYQIPLAITGLIIVVLMGIALKDSEIDRPITLWFNQANSGVVGAMATFTYEALQPIPSTIMVVTGMIIYLVRGGSWRLLAGFVGTVLLAWFPIIMWKKVFERSRISLDALADPSSTPKDFSFPSGHTAFITGLMVALLLISYKTHLEKLARILAPILITAIVLTVLITGVHYITDSIASIVWAFSVGPLAWIAIRPHEANDPQMSGETTPPRGLETSRARVGGLELTIEESEPR